MVNRSKDKIEINAVRKDNLFGVIRKVYERFIRIRGNPREVALGFALGVFVGMTPTMGVQMPIAIFFAALCKWSKLSAAIGVWISNPLTAPVLYGVTYITGARMMHLNPVFNMPLSPTWSTLEALLQKAPQALGAMTVGGAIIGLPLAIIGYYVSYAAVEKYQKDVKAKLARRKARLADTKDKIKKKVLERKIQKGGNGGRRIEVSEVGMRNAECGIQNVEVESSAHIVMTEGRGQMSEGLEVGMRNAEVGNSKQRAKSIAHREKTEGRQPMTGSRGQTAGDRHQSADEDGQIKEEREQKTEIR